MRKKNLSSLRQDESFCLDETVDIINEKKKESYEGKIVSVKGDKIIVYNTQKNKEEIYTKKDKKVIKQWNFKRPLQIYNRVDFELNNTNYWVEAIVIDIDEYNNKVLVKYKNNNRFKKIGEEWIYMDSNRIYPVGLYTKYDKSNNKFFSSNLSLSVSGSDFNNILGKKTTNNSISLSEEQELKFQISMKKINFLIKKVSGDGNCMFRAVSDQVYGSEQYHSILREKCMDYLVVQKRFFELFIEGDFNNYINEKRKNGTWGDDIELEALSEIYNRPIEIYSGSTKPLRSFHEDKKFYLDKNNKNKDIVLTPIRISYHGKKHYNSIVPIKNDYDNKYINYKNNIIKTKPGIYENKIIKIAKDNEERLDEGIKLSEDEYIDKLKKVLSGKKNEEIMDEIILALNKNNKDINDCDEDSKNENFKIKKEENKDVKSEEKSEEKNEKKEEEDKNKEEENNIEKSNINNKEKDEPKSKNNDDEYFNNPVIKAALELGFDLESAIEAWSIFGDNKELVINYLINYKNQNY